MLDSLLVENFKIFKKLEIPKLGRVNLFVGQNNSGKTCLLEAVQSYATGFDNIFDLITNREQNDEHINKYKSPFRFLFYGYKLPRENEKICIGNLHRQYDRMVFFPIYSSHDINYIESYCKKIHSISIKLKAQPSFKKYQEAHLQYISEPYINNQYVLASLSNQNSLNSILWDKVNLTPDKYKVIDCLKLIEPKILDFGFVDDEQGNRIPKVLIEDMKESIPLKTLGDGMTRLLNIILAMVNAKGGILLIDEIENGLHWSVHSKLWELVFTMAEKLDVQVFATTHSMDCVKGFNKAWAENEADGMFYRLQIKKDGDIKAIQYNQETLSDSIETEVEFR